MDKKFLLFIKKSDSEFLNIFSLKHKILLLSLIIGLVITFLVGSYSNKTQTDIANNLLRLHIVANSNSQFDQALKLKIRDAIVEEMSKKFKLCNNIEQTKQIALANLTNIENIAKGVIVENGKNYTVKASIAKTYFPTKLYGDMIFPAGKYEALIVKIGESKGANWWCVLFPPLCFVDATNGSFPEESKEKLRNTLNEEEYRLITSYSSDNPTVKIKFKAVELWQQSKQKVQVAISKLF